MLDAPASSSGWKRLSDKFATVDLDKSKVPVIHSVLKCVQAHPQDQGLQASAQRTIALLMKRDDF